MIPTAKLRFVKRKDEKGQRYILQQWWQGGAVINVGFGDVPVGVQSGEWRDVLVEQEQPR